MSIQEIRRSVLVVAGVAALAAAGLFAGRVSADAFPHKGRGDFAPRMFARMSRFLELTDDQQAQIKAVLKAHAAEIEVQMAAKRTARQALRQAMLAQPVDEAAIRARAEEGGKVEADGAVLFARIRTEIDPILTPDQRTKVHTFASRSRRRDSAVQSFDRFIKSGS
ncbi:MAG: Spy/CpxP family protein refolding chaperone [Acidobacteria bacterium]|nr:Spy/CpxP family protein refolding chaperone [Acidobacteriota bacterium]MCA1611171.1 Spy/CpxP family protein refolding chaperone [Acidobacteriota bacterium]